MRLKAVKNYLMEAQKIKKIRSIQTTVQPNEYLDKNAWYAYIHAATKITSSYNVNNFPK